jgi:hypothetical protein
VYRIDLGRVLKAVFALKQGKMHEAEDLQSQMGLMRKHNKLVSTDEFLTAEPVAVIEHEGDYFLATKYAPGKLLCLSKSVDDYRKTARYLAREHALMPKNGFRYSGKAKLASAVRPSFPKLLARNIMLNSDVLFSFEEHFPDVFEMDSHNEQYSVTDDRRVVAFDIEDKGDTKPYDDVAKLGGLGTEWGAEQRIAIGEAYLSEYQRTSAIPFARPELFTHAQLASSMAPAIRYFCFALDESGERKHAATSFLRNSIADARELLGNGGGNLTAENGLQLESLAKIAEEELLPQMTMA